MGNWFGHVRWCKDDLKNALELQGYPVTKNNISKLMTACKSRRFTDCMIEAGWEFMYNIIGFGDGWDMPEEDDPPLSEDGGN